MERFNLNKLSQPADWYYQDVIIEYQRNDNGHRCKNITEIDLDNYILFAGCSLTEGIGVELDKTYASLTSEHFKCNYYNLSLGGTGIDVMMHNLITWLSIVPKKPKAVVVQWSQRSRFMLLDKKNSDLTASCHGVCDTDPAIIESILLDDITNKALSRQILAKKLLETIAACPIVHILWDDEFKNILRWDSPNTSHMMLSKHDFARDLMHPGIKSNKMTSAILCNKLVNLLPHSKH